MENQTRETITELPEGWSLTYFDLTDPDYMAEYACAPYMIRITGGGADFNLQMHKGDFIEENINILDIDQANAFALRLMQDVSDMQSLDESQSKNKKNMARKINLQELRRLIERVISESGPESDIEISITRNEPDERRPESDKKPTYSVDYVYGEGDSMLQFSGSLNPYHTGRDTEYEFEPSWFQDEESEKYYEENWEEIEDQILEKFYSGEMLNENEMPNLETYSLDSIDGKYASKKSIINAVYDVLKKAKVEGIYSDENWLGVKKLTSALAGAGIDYSLQKANYTGHNSLYSDSSLPTKKEYKFFLKIHDREGKEIDLPLKVVCAFVGKTGTMEDDQYELTYVIEA